MNMSAITIGVNNGMDMVRQRQDREQKLRQEQEQHQANMAINKQQQSMNDLKIQQMEQTIDQTNKAIFRKDTDEALDTWSKYGDATLVKNLKDNSQFKKLFGDIADIKTVSELNEFDGLEDQLLLENGVPANEISKLTLDEKKEILKAQGDHLLVMTRADGSKITTNLEELTAATGRLNRADKKRKEEYTKAIVSGRLGGGLVLAKINGDDKTAKAFEEAIAATKTSKTSRADRPTSAMKNAEALGYKPGSEEYKEYIKDQTTPAEVRNRNARAEVIDKAPELAKEIEVGTLSPTSKLVAPAKEIETRVISKSEPLKAIVKEYSGTVDAMYGYGRVVDLAAKHKLTKNAITNISDRVDAMSNKKAGYVSDIWANMDDAKEFEKSIQDDKLLRRMADKELKLATVALIKSMSGLAVTDEEKKMYMNLAGADNMSSMEEAMLAAMTFISSKRGLLTKQLDRLADEAPIHAAIYRKQINDTLGSFVHKGSKPSKTDERKQIQARNREVEKISNNIFKTAVENFK